MRKGLLKRKKQGYIALTAISLLAVLVLFSINSPISPVSSIKATFPANNFSGLNVNSITIYNDTNSALKVFTPSSYTYASSTGVIIDAITISLNISNSFQLQLSPDISFSSFDSWNREYVKIGNIHSGSTTLSYATYVSSTLDLNGIYYTVIYSYSNLNYVLSLGGTYQIEMNWYILNT